MRAQRKGFDGRMISFRREENHEEGRVEGVSPSSALPRTLPRRNRED